VGQGHLTTRLAISISAIRHARTMKFLFMVLIRNLRNKTLNTDNYCEKAQKQRNNEFIGHYR
jgi:hypothetical protein